MKLYLEEINILEQEIFNLLRSSNISNEQFEEIIQADTKSTTLINNLTSIPGVAHKTIAAIISECGDLTRFPNSAKFIGYLGLFPTENSSGNSKDTGHLSKRGYFLAKQALYMSSVGCLLHNSELKNLYITKKSQGKSKKEAIIAVSRKLATIIYAIFKYNTPYNPNRVFAKS